MRDSKIYNIKDREKLPDIDSRCGNYFSYRDLIECSDTYKKGDHDNLPRELSSYRALETLAVNIIDPVFENFGNIALTYGFCGPKLAGKIKKRISPKLDQHAAHELNRNGVPICDQIGRAHV